LCSLPAAAFRQRILDFSWLSRTLAHPGRQSQAASAWPVV
jgi:hypothetical protein